MSGSPSQAVHHNAEVLSQPFCHGERVSIEYHIAFIEVVTAARRFDKPQPKGFEPGGRLFNAKDECFSKLIHSFQECRNAATVCPTGGDFPADKVAP